MRRCLSVLGAFFTLGCAHSSVIPLAGDTIQITTSAAPVCGATGAQSVGFRRAAIETVNRGFDRFVILGGQAQNNVRVVGTTPVTASTTFNGTGTVYGNNVDVNGTAHTVYGGGQPIIGGSHDQTFVIRMFHDNDPAGQNAVPARATLGDKWQEIVTEGTRTTC